MTYSFDAGLRSWSFAAWPTAYLLAIAIVYLCGWKRLHAQNSERWHAWQPCVFLTGLTALYLAIASPIDQYSSVLLQVHMVQHLLLMMVAPPLLWLGQPLLPVLRGLPASMRTRWITPLFRSKSLRRLFAFLTRPVPAWLLFVGITWFWHVPRMYEMALRVEIWHYVEHGCFLLTALLFWYPVIRPFPIGLSWSRWLLIPYLLLADIQNTALAALFTFSSEPLYPYYAQMPRVMDITPLDDQAAAGAIMWVPGSIAFLAPLFVIAVGLLFGGSAKKHVGKVRVAGETMSATTASST